MLLIVVAIAGLVFGQDAARGGRIYLGRAAPSSPYGAAGALIVLMFCTYYSTQIFLFGAELTKAIADERAPADRLVRNEPNGG